MTTTLEALDLRKTYPHSPNHLLGDYVILARTIDKARADAAGTVGEYTWRCGLSMVFFTFKGIEPDDFYAQIQAGKSGEEILAWVESTGTPRTQDEILAWSYDSRWRAPESVEMKAYVERNIREFNPKTPYIQSFFQMLDAEEGRL